MAVVRSHMITAVNSILLTLSTLVADGHARLAGMLAALVVAAPLGAMVVVVPTAVAVIDAASEGGILPGRVLAFALAIATSVTIVAAGAGTLAGPRVVTQPTGIRPDPILMAVGCVIAGAYLLPAMLELVATVLEPRSNGRPELVPVYGTVGLLILGLPALLLVVPHAMVWRALMRRASGPHTAAAQGRV